MADYRSQQVYTLLPRTGLTERPELDHAALWGSLRKLLDGVVGALGIERPKTP